MKLLKLLLKSTLALIVLAVVAVVALLIIINPNDYKPEIAQAVKDNTGRELTIDGDISWSFFPRLGFKIGHTEISNAAGFNARVFAEVDNIDVGLQIKPLLSGQVKVDIITLEGMTANLEIKNNGTTNWDDLSSPSGTEATAETTTEEATQESAEGSSNLGELPPISIGGLHIINAQVTYTDMSSGVAANLDNFTFKTGEIVLWDPISFDGSFFVENKYPQLTLDVAYGGTLIADLPNNTFGIQGFKLDLDTKGEPIPNGAMKLAIEADVDANTATEVAELAKLVIAFDETTISGNATVNNFAKPAIDFSVDINQLNADRYLPATPTEEVTLEEEAPSASPATPEDVQIALPMDTLRDLNVDGKLTVGAFQVMNLKTQNFKAVLSAHNGIINLKPLGIELYEGVFDGGVTIDAQNATPKYAVKANLSDLAIGPFAQDLADFGLVNAKGSLNVDITTEGDWVSKLKRNLNGGIDVKLADAVIEGDMEGVMGVLLNVAEGSTKNEDGTSKFDAVTAWVSLEDGVATTRNLNMTGATILVSGGGSFDIPTEYVDASPSISISGSESCPVVLKGKLAELDYAKAAKRAIPDCLKARAKAEIDKAKAEAEAKVKEKIEEEKQKAKKKLEDKAKEELKKLFKF